MADKLEVIRAKDLEPEDVVILRLGENSTVDPTAAGDTISRQFPINQCIVLTKGSKIRILRQKNSENSPSSEDSSGSKE